MKAARIPDPSDEQLIREYLQGDADRLGILYERYYLKVYYRCLNFAGNPEDAFDMAQDILMKAFSSLESFKGIAKFSTWLFAITQNHCISQAKKSKRECFPEARPAFSLIDNEQEEYEARFFREELELRLEHFLSCLPAEDRKLLELKYRHDYSVKDLQKEFNLSASAVKMRLLRARYKIEQIIVHHRAA